jgi:mono/diheme cytochrome c family protein
MLSKSLKTALLFGALLACSAPAVVVAAPADSPPAADPGKAIVNRACQSCHDLGMVTEARHTSKEWAGVIERMRGNGADLTDEDAKQVQAYLAKVYGKPG